MTIFIPPTVIHGNTPVNDSGMNAHLPNMRTINLFVATTLLASLTLQAEVDFKKDIAPIFESRCLECHGPKKQKGKMRLDSAADLFKHEDVVVKGDAAGSEMYKRITLPEGDDDIMPSKGDPLSEKEQGLIRDWINGGAAWPEGLVLGPKEDTSTKVVTDWPKEHTASGAEQKAIAKLNETGISVRPIAQNSPWLTANLRVYSGELNDELLGNLGQVVGLVDLNLANTKITDSQLEKLASLNNLMTLHLENTAVTDNGLKQLAKMEYLNYLNLYGTAVTDAGLESLNGLSRLRKLYLWETKVTPEGVSKLNKAIPEVIINTGETLKIAKAEPEAKKDEPKPEEKK